MMEDLIRIIGTAVIEGAIVIVKNIAESRKALPDKQENESEEKKQIITVTENN